MKHRYSILLADGSVLTFKSNCWIGSMHVTFIDNEPILHFIDSDVQISTNKIREITIDGVKYKIGYYAH